MWAAMTETLAVRPLKRHIQVPELLEADVGAESADCPWLTTP
jgi:hypothetical protein